MSSIGPYLFTIMDGRLQAASSPTVPTLRGLKPGARRPVVQPLVTTEEQVNLIAAWVQALRYRLAVGAAATITDDGGVICPVGLICDVRCLIRQAVGAVSLVTTWSVLPALSYADYGQATVMVPVDAQGVTTLTTPAPVAASSTAIVIGGHTFTTCTGDLQWPISESQVTAVSKGARAIGGSGASARPDTGSGQLDCAVEVADEAAGVALMAAVRAMVGTYIDVSIGGVTISGVAVQDAAADWAETKVLPNGATRLVQATFSLDVQDASGTGGPAAEVQIATNWGNWQTVPKAWCEQTSEGLSGSTGSVTWVQDVGRILRDGKTLTAEPTDFGARWVRIRARTASDGTASAIGTTMTPIWWGVVQRDRISTENGGSATRIVTCAGIMAALSQCWATRWYETARNNAGMTNPGEVPPFNYVPGGDGGGIGINEMRGFTIHNRSNTGGQTPWTLRQMVDVWLAAFKAQYPQGPILSLGGQVAALSVQLPINLGFVDFGNGLCELISEKIGVAFRLEVATTGNELVTVRVSTGVATNTTVPGLGIFPANDRAGTVDLTGNDIGQVQLVRGHEATVDHLVIWGGHPTLVTSFRFGTAPDHTYQLEKGWTIAEEATWLTATVEQRNSPQLSHVWRRWRLAADWDGSTWWKNGNQILKMDYVTAADTAHGAAFGFTGEFEIGPGATPFPNSANLRFKRDLDISDGIDWVAAVDEAVASGYSAGPNAVPITPRPSQQRMGPLLFGVSPAIQYSNLTYRWHMQVEENYAGILLGNDANDGADIKTYLDGKNYFILTIALIYPLPWIASWRRGRDDRPRDMERALVLPYPRIEYQQIHEGTVFGLVSSVEVAKTAATARTNWETTPGSNVSKLDPLLAMHLLKYSRVAKSLSWERRGIIDVSTATAPGSLVTTAMIPLDSARSYTETINLMITGRTHRLLGGEIATAYTCEPWIPSLDRVAHVNPMPLMNIGKAPAQDFAAASGYARS